MVGWLQGRSILAEDMTEQSCLIHRFWETKQGNSNRGKVVRDPIEYTVLYLHDALRYKLCFTNLLDIS